MLFHSPHRGAFHRSLTVLSTIGRHRVFSLGPWAAQLPAGFLVSRRTCGCAPMSPTALAYGALTRCGPLFQARSANRGIGHSSRRAAAASARIAQPPPGIGRQATQPGGFGLFRGRSPLLPESSLFLRVLRCFSSPTCLGRSYGLTPPSPGMARVGLPHSEIDGSLGARPLPVALRSPATSFLGPWRLGIHRTPVPLDPPSAHSTNPPGPPHRSVRPARASLRGDGLDNPTSHSSTANVRQSHQRLVRNGER